MNEARLHTLFGVLFVLSVFLSEQVEKVLPTWNDPKLGLLSFVVAILWLVLFFMSRGSTLNDDVKVLKDRVERMEHRVRSLEDEQE
jgi:hypothetical protein